MWKNHEGSKFDLILSSGKVKEIEVFLEKSVRRQPSRIFTKINNTTNQQNFTLSFSLWLIKNRKKNHVHIVVSFLIAIV